MASKTGLERKMGPPKFKKWGSWEGIFTTFVRPKFQNFLAHAAAPLGGRSAKAPLRKEMIPPAPEGGQGKPTPPLSSLRCFRIAQSC